MPITRATTASERLDWYSHAQTAGVWPRTGAVGAPAAATALASAHDAAFVALKAAFRSHGGIAHGESLAARLSRDGRNGHLELARSILAGRLFSFHWHDSFWLPVFQFEPLLPTPRAAPRRVLDELHGSLDGWSIANWYVRARDDLCGGRPLDLLDSDLSAVLAAARAERAARAV